MKHVIVALLGFAVIMTLAGCNTLRGAGRDIQSMGRGLERVSSYPNSSSE